MSRTEVFSSPCSMQESDLGFGENMSENNSMEIQASNTILYCENWQESVHFYKEVLGFRVCFTHEDWFMELEINAGARISLAAADRCTIKPGKGTGITLSWRVAELEPIHEKLSHAGIRLTEIKGQGWRLPFFYVWDPEGHRIEYWTPKRKALNTADI